MKTQNKEQVNSKSINKIFIEKLRKEDVKNLIELYKQLNPEIDIDSVSPILMDDYFYGISLGGNFNIFVLKVDNKIVSTCTFAIIPNIAQGMKPNGIIESFVTDKDNRRKGYGKKLIEYILEFARDIGCLKVSLLTKNDNEAIQIYENVGFKENIRRSFVLTLD